MTPKEKAVELYEKYYYITPSAIDSDFTDSFVLKSALILVNEMLDTINQLTLEYDYWLDVKREIINL